MQQDNAYDDDVEAKDEVKVDRKTAEQRVVDGVVSEVSQHQ